LALDPCFFGEALLHFFNLKNMISTHGKDFCENNGPNSLDFKKNLKYISPFFVYQVPKNSQNIK